MKFSKDTSRLVEGRMYWCIGTGDQEPYVAHYRTIDASCGYLWGDEVIPPTVEVEPERPATPALLPCPFCGGTDVAPSSTEDEPEWNQWVRCASCEAEGPTRTGGHAAAIAAWNTRAAPPAPAEPTKWTKPNAEPKWSEGPSWTPPAERPSWTPPVCPAGQFVLDPDGRVRQRIVDGFSVDGLSRYPKPSWPPRIGEIVEVLFGDKWLQLQVSSSPWRSVTDYQEEYVEVARWSIARSNEGKTWRWVYRDLSDYTPPGGAP